MKYTFLLIWTIEITNPEVTAHDIFAGYSSSDNLAETSNFHAWTAFIFTSDLTKIWPEILAGHFAVHLKQTI